MLWIAHTLADTNDPTKVLMVVGFAVVWIVLAILGGIAKTKDKTKQKRSWEQILGQLSGQPGHTGTTMPMPSQQMRPRPIPPPIPKAKSQQRKPKRQAVQAPPQPTPVAAPVATPAVQPPMARIQRPVAIPASTLSRLVTATNLRAQVVVSEILSKPLALREE